MTDRYTYIHTETDTHKQRHAGRQTDRHAHAYLQKYIHTERHTNTDTDTYRGKETSHRQTHTYLQSQTQKGGFTDGNRQIIRHPYRHIHTYRARHIPTYMQTVNDGQRDRHTDGQATHTYIHIQLYK